MDSLKIYEDPLSTRYASREMAALWSSQRRIGIWRRLWVALAEAQMELGLKAADGKTPRIQPSQVEALRAKVDDIDFALADRYERKFRHDVMAHIHAYGDIVPEAKDIIHLGATSCFVTDNAEVILMREGLEMLCTQLASVLKALGDFALSHKDLVCLGFTHFQPAQLTTIGKRACLWAQDFLIDLVELEHRLDQLRFRGTKGTTGTQASFLALFDGDHEKVVELDKLVARKMGFSKVWPVTGQTYPRKMDAQILEALGGICQSAHRWGSDLRLLSHRQELDEPFEESQIGSSAMPYKRNPMRAERMCGLARYGMSLPANADQTAAVQWLERTLDDSVNRRLSIPQAFLTADSILKLALNIARGMKPNPEVIKREVEKIMPYMLTENLMMAAVAQGGDRQELHEVIRVHSHAVTAALKTGAPKNDLLERLAKEKGFQKVDFQAVREKSYLAGRAPEQVVDFLKVEVEPQIAKYKDKVRTGSTVER